MRPSLDTADRAAEKLAWAFGLLFLTLLSPGCHSVLATPQSGSLDKWLQPGHSAPNHVALEIFHLRVPEDQAIRLDRLWGDVDEQSLPVDVRRRLIANGFRAGVIAGALPDDLVEWLGLQSKPQEEASEFLVTERSASPRVRRRVVQVDSQEPILVHASESQARLRVLIAADGNLSGREYSDAEAVYGIRAENAPGQRVALHVTPELHHGEHKPRYTGRSGPGVMMMVASRERDAFEALKVDADLSPGNFLMLGSLPDAGSSLGEAFHQARGQAVQEHKLLLIRVLQVPPSEILADD